jgi:pimeloyl-ACP methyl ester carboxylesterase
LVRLSGDAGERSPSAWKDWAGSFAAKAERLARTKTEDSREGTVDVGGARLTYRSVGEGPTLVVLHDGPDGDSRALVPAVDALAEDLRVVTYDRRGRGPGRSASQLEGLTPEQDVADLEALRRSIGAERIHILGHGFGGLLAVAYAAAHPQHTGRVIMLDTGLPTARHDDVREDAAKQRLPEPWKSALADLERTRHTWDQETWAAVAKRIMFVSELHDTSWLPYLEAEVQPEPWAVERIRKAWSTWDGRGALASLSAPVLALVAEGSALPASEAGELREIAKKNARLRVETLSGTGRYALTEAPGRTVDRITEFLED